MQKRLRNVIKHSAFVAKTYNIDKARTLAQNKAIFQRFKMKLKFSVKLLLTHFWPIFHFQSDYEVYTILIKEEIQRIVWWTGSIVKNFLISTN